MVTIVLGCTLLPVCMPHNKKIGISGVHIVVKALFTSTLSYSSKYHLSIAEKIGHAPEHSYAKVQRVQHTCTYTKEKLPAVTSMPS